MRYQGRIVRWNEARGFGFIAPEQGDGEPKRAELFVHISALQSDGSLPKIGERVSYQLGCGQMANPWPSRCSFRIGRCHWQAPNPRPLRADRL